MKGKMQFSLHTYPHRQITAEFFHREFIFRSSYLPVNGTFRHVDPYLLTSISMRNDNRDRITPAEVVHEPIIDIPLNIFNSVKPDLSNPKPEDKGAEFK